MRGARQRRTTRSTLRALAFLSVAIVNAILWIDLLFLLLFGIFTQLACRGFCWTIVFCFFVLFCFFNLYFVSNKSFNS